MKPIIFTLLTLFLLNCRDEVKQELEQTIPTTFSRTTFALNSSLKEISALLVINDQYYGINDSGGDPKLYQINSNGEISKTIIIGNATNVDWESLAMNESQIFLADTGNNQGNRTDLKIYSIPISALNSTNSTTTVQAETINFHYPEQSNFGIQTYQHDFDCEAMVWFNNQLHLFTKQWLSKKTAHYTLDTNFAANQEAQYVETFDTQFLVTGADIIALETTNLLGLIGYTTSGEVFLARIKTNGTSTTFSASSMEKFLLGSTTTLGQVEGIALESDKTFYISAEKYNQTKQNISKFIQNE